MASVKVAVRARPFNRRETDMNSTNIISMNGNTTQLTNIKLPATANESFGRERLKQFTYDYSYWSVDADGQNYASQKMVFDDLGFDVVQSAYTGYNVCVFAYGQTGSGKTYTMMGSPDNPGLTPRICESLFAHMVDADYTYRTEVSYLEIYNERVHDLLRDRNQTQLNLKVREHPKDGPYVQDLSRHVVMSYGDIEELLKQGNGNRTTAATNMNDHSSRSHAIFTILFSQAKFTDDLPTEVHSKIHLVDLAGSERADAAGTSSERLKEGGSINKSLVTLGNVISSLADMSDKTNPSLQRRSVFIPYRDSVLTWLLKDSLGGNSKTIMIATISPAECCYAETLSTLRYAKRAKKIVNKPTVNEDPNVKLIRELRAENARLRKLLADSMLQGGLTPLTDVVETREKLTRNEEKVQELIENWAVKWEEAACVLREHEMLALRKEGAGVVLDSYLPYLICIDDNILSTGMKLYHLKEGETTVGREDAAKMPDIVLVGRLIEANHCVIHYHEGEVTLVPAEGAMCYVDSNRVFEQTKLSQGSVIQLGRSHFFRFNNPVEAAKMREELKENGLGNMSQVWKDFQWTWSNMSMTDSAVGSETFGTKADLSVGDWTEFDRLEEKRREVERLEEDHCLAEARRVSQFAALEANKEQLKQKEEELHRLSFDAHQKIETLSASIQQQYYVTKMEKERLLEEQMHLQEMKERIELDKEQTQTENERAKRKSQLELDLLQMEKERQMEEWIELEKEREHQHVVRMDDQKHFEKQREQIEKVRTIEKNIWNNEIAEMRNLVDAELNSMRMMAGLACSSPIERSEGGIDDEEDSMNFDIESMRLRLSSDEGDSCPFIPSMYFLPSSSELSENVFTNPDSSVDTPCSSSLEGLMEHLSQEVCDIHEQVCLALLRKYGSVLRNNDQIVGLDALVMEQFGRVKPLFEQIEKLLSEETSEPDVINRLKEYDCRLSVVDKFVQIHVALQNVERELTEKSFKGVAIGLEFIHAVMRSTYVEEEMEGNVKRVIQTELCVVRERLLYELSEEWNRLLKWTVPVQMPRGRVKKTQSTSLEISCGADERERMLRVAEAMLSVNMLESRLKGFADHLMNHVIDGIVKRRDTSIQVVEEPSRCVISVVVHPAEAGRSQAPPPAEVYQKLQQIFELLHRVFTFTCDDDSCGLNLVEKLGSLLMRRMFKLIFDECLSQAFPKSGTEWETFSQVIMETENFQEQLSRLRFLGEGLPSLIDLMNNVNNLFANVKNHEILKKAHQMMVLDLVPSVQISSEYPVGPDREEMDSFVKKCKEQAGTSNYKLPKCKISVTVCNLVCLAYDTLKEALSGSQEIAFLLSHIVQNVFELFCDVVPSYHREKLTSQPSLAALQHNNCSFVAHHLMTFNASFCRKLNQSGAFSSSPDDKELNLASLVPKLRKLGNDGFTEHVQMKKEQLCQCLEDAKGFSCTADDDGAAAMKATQNMLHHLKHLSTIWIDVLPVNVYSRSIGSVLCCTLEEIIDAILVIDEFSEDDCKSLQKIFDHVLRTAPQIFSVEGFTCGSSTQVALHEFVSNWMKFSELNLVFASKLQDISDRWADGKGPLALHFTGEQISKLVTAMFENTKKRDSLLAQLRSHPSIHLT